MAENVGAGRGHIPFLEIEMESGDDKNMIDPAFPNQGKGSGQRRSARLLCLRLHRGTKVAPLKCVLDEVRVERLSKRAGSGLTMPSSETAASHVARLLCGSLIDRFTRDFIFHDASRYLQG